MGQPPGIGRAGTVQQMTRSIENCDTHTAGAQIQAEHQRFHRGSDLAQFRRLGFNVFPGGLQVVPTEVAIGSGVLIKTSATLFG